MTRQPTRSRYDLMAIVLKICKKPTKWTGIFYRGILSGKQTKNYLHVLIEAGMIRQNEKGYVTVEKGCKFIAAYDRMKHLLLTED